MVVKTHPSGTQAADEAEKGALAVQLRISGGTAEGNHTDAEALGRFITHIAEAARAISHAVAEDRYEESRDSSGRATKRKVKTRAVQLQELAAPQGRVSLIFRAPELDGAGQLGNAMEEHLPLEDFPEDTIEAEALRAIFRAFTLASAADEVDPDALVEPLQTPGAREAVRKAVAVVSHNGWQLGGTISQANRADEALSLTSRGGARLIDALKADLIGKYRAPLRGTIDGHKNSNNTIYFRPKNAPQSWSTIAATDVIYAEAARISLDIENQVDLTLEFEPKADREGNPTERVVRRIVSIDKVYGSKTGERLF